MPNKCSDRQTNFKLSHGNTFNDSIPMEMRPFQQQQCGNQNPHSKIMAKQRFKKIFKVVLLKVSNIQLQFLM